MRDEGASFDSALKEAQKLGYAEANPSADVDGIDAARKIVILAALASGMLIPPKSIYTEGITAISLLDTKIAEELNCSIKLIGQAHINEAGLTALVSPCMVPKTNPLSRIDDVFNGILIDANMVGEVMFYGPGAGKLPTASAVVADIIDVIAHLDSELKTINWTEASADDVAPFEDFSISRVLIANGDVKLPADVKILQKVTMDGASASSPSYC